VGRRRKSDGEPSVASLEGDQISSAGLHQAAWEETSMELQKRSARPRHDDPEREQRYAKIVALLERTPRPPRPTRFDFACLNGICATTANFLAGDYANDATWQKRLW
jgi:hypothetical protein